MPTLPQHGKSQKVEVEHRPLMHFLMFQCLQAHNFVITDDDLGVGGAKTKYRYNVEAIRTLRQIESENRLATPDEQETLSRYVGWGGLADAFDENKSAWTNEYVELNCC